MISFDEFLKQADEAVEGERKRAQLAEAHEQAQVATLAKTNFLTNMSHEIRTPLSAILGLVDVLIDSGDLDSAPIPRLEALDGIKRNGQHLMALLNDVLDLAKIQAGRVAVEAEPFSPIDVVSDAVRLMEGRAQAKQLALSTRFSGPLPEAVGGDPVRVTRILVNLISNAIKFTETGGVSVDVALEASTTPVLRIAVRDTGIGIAADALQNLFMPFEQADNTTSRKFGGTGLGLSISRHLAQLMAGDLDVESTPGEGSCFTLRLPTGPLEGLELRELQPEAGGPRVRPQQSHSIPFRILVAEDFPDNQRVIRHVLERAGASVDMVDDGHAAVDRALNARELGSPFDVILMDMQMPGLDGYDATRQLRASGYGGAIIALTAHALDGDEERCIEAGCDAYTTKPIHPANLARTITALLKESDADSTS